MYLAVFLTLVCPSIRRERALNAPLNIDFIGVKVAAFHLAGK